MITLTIFVLILLAGVQGDIKILSTPSGTLGHEPCARICSGVDTDYRGWKDSHASHGKTYKYVWMSDCDFISTPVITVTSRSVTNSRLCPTFTISYNVWRYKFRLHSVPDFTADKMARYQCGILWTAVGFVC